MTELHLPLRLVHHTEPSAVFNACGTYRYRLVRVWDPALPLLGVVMLHPVKSQVRRSDATMRCCSGIARGSGYGGIVVRNLYALMSRHHERLGDHPDPVGPDNDAELAQCSEHDLTVLAWGPDAEPARAHHVAFALWRASCAHGTSLAVLGWTDAGQPEHPLSVCSGTTLKCYTPALSADAHEDEDPRWGQLFFRGVAA
jgi:hypothetical protein